MQYNRVRFDTSGSLGEAVETPQGGLAIPAYVTRAGIFDYEQEDGSIIREYRPPEEVFAPESLATLPNAPLCNEHPSVPVDTRNYARLAVGHVENGSVKQDENRVAARLIFQDERTIKDIRRGKRELSCGYNCDVDETSGISAEGRYDRIQRNIRYNHVALVPDGRAGPTVRLRLDSKGNQNRGDEMEKEYEMIGGVRHETGTPGHADAVKRRDKMRADGAAKVKALRADRDKQAARADAAEAKIKKLEALLSQAQSPQRLDHAVKVRGAVMRRAAVALGADYKMDGLSIKAIKLAAVKAYHPTIKLDKKSDDYVNALFRAIPPDGSAPRRDSNGAMRLDANDRIEGGNRLPGHLRQPPPNFKRDGSGPTMDDYRARRNDAEESRHRRPLAVSKSNPNREMDGYPAVQGSMLENMR